MHPILLYCDAMCLSVITRLATDWTVRVLAACSHVVFDKLVASVHLDLSCLAF